ncbi:MAG: SMP-30/gluconolactonase/LRE family protein [Salinarimonadaceae bacterium]|nr:MAG: SMP-30/gluconolactonase/LRE family protein [Salinarimonadaceae bacterium]
MASTRIIRAELFTRLPESLHHCGEPTEWVRVTRPGQRLHSFLEGPCFDAQGRLWLVDVPYGRIFRIEPDGGWTQAFAYDGEPHAIRRHGETRFAIADHRRGVLLFDPADDSLRPLCSGVNAEPFRGLGDLAVAANGDIWFTDPGRSSLSDPTGRLFRLDAGATEPRLVLANIPYPNGVALSADGSRVLIAVTRANAIWSILARAPDPVFPMAGVHIQLSGGLGPDGLAVDGAGRLAVAQAQAGRAYLFDRYGDLLADIRTPGGDWTTACAFSPDGGALYIIDAQNAGIYRADVKDIE